MNAHVSSEIPQWLRNVPQKERSRPRSWNLGPSAPPSSKAHWWAPPMLTSSHPNQGWQPPGPTKTGLWEVSKGGKEERREEGGSSRWKEALVGEWMLGGWAGGWMSGWVGGKKEGKMGGRERERMARWMGGSISPPDRAGNGPGPAYRVT